jgi:predicted small lipoprotein YifL
MKKVIALAALLALAACGKKPDAAPAADSPAATPAPAAHDSTMKDSTMARDTAHQM